MLGFTIAAILALLFAYDKGRSSAKNEAEEEKKDEAKKAANKQITAATEAKDVQAKVSSSTDADVDKQLLEFTRDKNN